MNKNFLGKIINRFKNLSTIIKIIFIICTLLIILFLSLLIWYNNNVNGKSDDLSNIVVKIEMGSGNSKIADTLEQSGVINSSTAFKIYTKLNKISDLKAGTYSLNESMSFEEITEELKKGIVFSKEAFDVTFIEGKNMRWIAKYIAENTNNSEKDVFDLLKDDNYIDSIIDEYWFLTEDIKNKDIYYPLEGYLFPDTYNVKNKDITVKEIFKIMLDKTDKVLEKYRKDIENSKYSIHEILTLASLIEAEGISKTDRKNISSVFYNRLNGNMSLGSDVTTYYAVKIDMGDRDLYQTELDTYNPYNTRGPKMEGKLPIGPICSSSQSAIEAAIYPTNTDYYYFVADKNGKVHFTSTFNEHKKTISDLKKNNLWFIYE